VPRPQLARGKRWSRRILIISVIAAWAPARNPTNMTSENADLCIIAFAHKYAIPTFVIQRRHTRAKFSDHFHFKNPQPIPHNPENANITHPVPNSLPHIDTPYFIIMRENMTPITRSMSTIWKAFLCLLNIRLSAIMHHQACSP